MTREEAITEIKEMADYWDEEYPEAVNEIEALRMAIDALKVQQSPKFTRITIDTDERWLNRKFDVFKDRLYLNEKTMIIYVPFVSFELVSKSGGTIKRIGEKE